MIERAYVGGLALSLLVISGIYIADAVGEIRTPFQLDYGEGIVLYQASTVVHLSSAYKPIDQYPYVVFHYPPMYHLAVVAVEKWVGDLLLSGRIVSFVSALLIQVVFGLVVFFSLPRRLGPSYRGGAALFAALLPSCLYVMTWTRLARVDSLALLLSFGGAALFVLGNNNQVTKYGSFALFVGALFTKQTMVAAPLACFIVMLAIDVKTALRIGVFAGALGGGILTALSWATNGEVIKHLFLYNQNTFDLRRLLATLSDNSAKMVSISILAVGVTTAAGIETWRLIRKGRWQRVKLGLEYIRLQRLIAVWSLLLAFALLVSFTAGKTGSSYNYFLEWNLACCVLAAIAFYRVLEEARRRRRLTLSTLVLLMVPLFIVAPNLPHPVAELGRLVTGKEREREGAENTTKYQSYNDALALVRESAGPVFSEDMWLLVKSGKEVPAEPAIVRELVATGRWDERPFIRMIEEKRFSKIVITSDLSYSAHFTPRVAEAIGVAYQRTRQVGKYKIYEPRTADTRHQTGRPSK